MDVIRAAGRFNCPPEQANNYTEQLSVQALSIGTYSIPAGGTDDQRPHVEDEVYVVTAGRAHFSGGAFGSVPVGPGDVLYVAAGDDHRFTDVVEDLALVVVFAPPYSGRTSRPGHTGPGDETAG